tara:strand:- start:5281 stop:5763 length:483 start_codon:yes stop_codon:yes gene_type:complete
MEKLEPILKELKTVTDKINQPIDEDIIEMVAVLNYLGFPTNSSCQGHPDTPGVLYPHITIAHSDEEFEFDKDGEYQRYAKKNLALQPKLITLLNEFYINRTTEHQHRLIFNTIQCCIIELQPLSSYSCDFIKDQEEKYRIHSIYKKEMDDFRDFLKTKIK